jgi:type I restriction enzyme, R subunit
VLDWRKKQQAKARVRQTVEDALDKLPDSITGTSWLEACDAVYAHVYEAYKGEGQSIYT